MKMTESQLLTALNASGISFRYHHWPVGSCPTPPFGVYLRTSTNNVCADGKVYCKATHYNVELYTSKKDVAAEQLVETALDTVGIPWQVSSEIYIESEDLYQTIYEIEV